MQSQNELTLNKKPGATRLDEMIKTVARDAYHRGQNGERSGSRAAPKGSIVLAEGSMER